jgi:hypothetical protein
MRYLLWNPKVHYCVYKSLLLVPTTTTTTILTKIMFRESGVTPDICGRYHYSSEFYLTQNSRLE